MGKSQPEHIVWNMAAQSRQQIFKNIKIGYDSVMSDFCLIFQVKKKTPVVNDKRMDMILLHPGPFIQLLEQRY